MDELRAPGDSPFQQALAAGRKRYNALFAQARRRSGSPDVEGFSAELREEIAPIVDAAGTEPGPVADALIDLWLAVPRRPAGFATALLHLAPFVGREPHRLPVAVLNALHHIESSPAGRASAWIDAMSNAARSAPDVPTLLDVGAVASWRCGVAQLRAAALRRAQVLPKTLRSIAFGEDVDDTQLPAYAGDPWYDPNVVSGGQPRIIRRAGAFAGFGGVFARPPVVWCAEGAWFASDGAGCWRVHADRFGYAFTRVADRPAVPATEWRPDADLVAAVPELERVTSWAGDGNTLAVTTAFTHAILFVVRR